MHRRRISTWSSLLRSGVVLTWRHLMVIKSTSRHLPVLHRIPCVWSTLILLLRIVSHRCHCAVVSLLLVLSTCQVLGLTLSGVLLHHHRGTWLHHVHWWASLVSLLRSLMAHWMSARSGIIRTTRSGLLGVTAKVWLDMTRAWRRVHLLAHGSVHKGPVGWLLHHHVSTHLRTLRAKWRTGGHGTHLHRGRAHCIGWHSSGEVLHLRMHLPVVRHGRVAHAR